MQFENILKCHLNFVHLIEEQDILQCDCLSLTDEHDTEQMIFLGKNTKSNEYEVRVYKSHPKDTYIPSILDFKLKRCEENDEFASFFFDRFFFARRFISTLKDYHPEYNVRPI